MSKSPKPPPGLKATEKRLLSLGIVHLVGDVNERMRKLLMEQLTILETMGSPKVELRIDSSGGDCDAGFAIIDLIRLYKGEVTGVIISRAHSMASIILQSCDYRKMSMNATIVIHSVRANSISLDTLRSKKLLARKVQELEDLQYRGLSLYMQKATVPKKRIAAIMKEDRRMRSDEALELGLVDEII